MNHRASIAKSVSPIRNLVVRLSPRLLASSGSGRRPSLFLAALLALAAALCVLLAAPWPVFGQQSDQEVPARPTGLTGTVSPEQVSLSWDDPGDSSITGYQVLRRNPAVDAKGVFHTVVDDTGSSGTSYVDTTVAAETRYFYRVLARNAAGLSPKSGLFRADVPPPDPDATRPGATDLGDVTSQEGVIHRDGSVLTAHRTVWTISVIHAHGGPNGGAGPLCLRRPGRQRRPLPGGRGRERTVQQRKRARQCQRVHSGESGRRHNVLREGASPAPWGTTITGCGTGSLRGREQSTPENSAASGSPAITGTAQVHETLSADTSGIADANGLSNVEYAYRWIRSTGGVDTDIGAATGSTYTLVRDDLGHTIRVRVSLTDDDGYPETLTSAATGPVVRPPNASPGGQPAVSGVLAVGKTLTADTSGITDPNGLGNPGFTHQWARSIGSTDTDILGATGSSYTISSSDVGNAFKVTVAFTDDDGYAETLTSDPTEVLETKGQDGQDNGVQPRVAPTSSPQNLRATSVFYASLKLEWDEPDTGITHIRFVRTGGNLPTDTLVALSGSTHNRARGGLEPDTGYTFTVEFGNSATEFGPAATINVRTLPIPAPTNVRVDSQATRPDAVEVTFEWDNPATSGRLTSSIAVYDETVQIQEYLLDYTDLRESVRLTQDLDTTYNFATWYRTVDENGAYHVGPKAYLEFTTARLPEVSISDASVEEGGTLTFTLTITDFADRRVGEVRVVPVLILGETEAEDYSGDRGQSSFPFDPGQSTKTIEFTTVDDDLYEGDETVTLELTNPSGLTIGRGTATGTITDNDPLPLLSPLDATIAEDRQGFFFICIESEPAAEQPFDVALRYSGTATPGADYTGVNTLTLAGGNTPHCNPITIIDDNIYEGDETIIYTLQEEPGSYRVARAATITIRENDPVPRLTVTAFPGAEGGRNQGNTPVGGQEFGNVVFRFNLDRPAAVPISMDLETIDGAAVRGDDYRFNNPTLVFPAGQTEMFIKLPVIDDADFDGTRNEDFDLVASNPSVPVFTGRLSATGYIVDNETPPPGVDYVDDSVQTDAYIDVGESWVEGNAVVGGVEYRYDQDWYRTVLRANRCYQIEVRGKDAWEDFQEYPDDDPIQEYAPSQELTLDDPLIHGVYTDLGNYMPNTQEEYGGVGLGAVKLVTIDQTGTVYIAVSHAWYGDDDENEGGGTFDLSLIDLGRGSCTRMDPSVTDAWASITYRRHHSVSEGEGRDLPGDISTTGYVQPDGDPATGNIGANGDLDFFKVPLVAGRSYRIEMKGDEESDYGGTLDNPRVRLVSSTADFLNSQSEELASFTGDQGHQVSDNNSGRGKNARLEVEVNVTDSYFITVQTIVLVGRGTYTVVVTTIAN